jgi:magnesium transporter
MADESILDDNLLPGDPAEVPVESEVRPDDRVDDERHDEENRLKPSFINAVHDALAAGDKGAVYDLVEPLHAADIADLIELLERSERALLARTITDLMTSDVIAELNDYVREDLMEALPASRIWTRPIRPPLSQSWSRKRARRWPARSPIPKKPPGG